MLELNKTYLGDCLEVMKDIDDKSIDLILTDLPYGTTSCKWDVIIPFEPLWTQYKRIIKSNGAIVLTASQPFTSALVMSNPDMFKYEWIWEKSRPVGHLNAKKRPMMATESVLIFYENLGLYNPQGLIEGNFNNNRPSKSKLRNGNCVYGQERQYGISKFANYPNNILRFNNPNNNTVHPTQKPVALFEYLIKTYTNEGELVLDNCAGSGTTAVACINTNRNYILIEKEDKYVEICNKRVEEAKDQHALFKDV